MSITGLPAERCKILSMCFLFLFVFETYSIFYKEMNTLEDMWSVKHSTRSSFFRTYHFESETVSKPVSFSMYILFVCCLQRSLPAIQIKLLSTSKHFCTPSEVLYHNISLTPRWWNSWSLVLLQPNKSPFISLASNLPTYATKFTCTQADLGRTTWSWFMTSTFSTLWPINKQLSDGGIQRRFHSRTKRKKTWRAYSLPSKPQSQGPMAEFVSRRDHSRMLVVMWCWAPYQSCPYIRLD